uniref:Uncharacterized protein n=1 Tax=Pseudomonas phage HRDY3 TaxID=3236930 RepID=A0AB39CDY8_9VIRU
MRNDFVMPSHISDRLYEHTNAWTNCWSLPDAEKLDSVPVIAMLISRISPLYKEMVNHVYFEAESREEGHVGYYKTIPVFIPSLSFKSGAPIRLVTNINRQAHGILEKFL